MEQKPNVSVDTKRYVEKCVSEALGRYRRQAIIGFLILLAGLAIAVKVETDHNSTQRDDIVEQGKAAQKAIVASGDAVAVSGCNRDYDTIDSLRDELERSLLRIDSLEQDGTYSPRQAEVARKATQDILTRYTLPDCRKADDFLTANPGKTVATPEPRYPDDPQQLESERNEQHELEGTGRNP